MGVLSASFFACNKIALAVISLCFLALCIVTPIIFNGKAKLKVNLIIIAIIFTVSAVGFASSYLTFYRFERANLQSGYYTVTGRVGNISYYEDSTTLLIDKAQIAGSRTGKIHYKIALTVSDRLNEVQLGSIVKFSTHLHDRSIVYEDKISAYNIQNDAKYFADVTASEFEVLGYKPNVFQAVNNFIKTTLQEGLDKAEFSVAYAMLTGNDDFIDGTTLENYRNAGVAHVFAVSGLHIGFLATALGYLINKTRLNKKIGFGLTVAVLILYSGICGFSASSVRAVIMCAVLLSSKLLGVKYDSLSAIGLACVLILAINPIELFCAGFQLSFTVVLGMAIMTKPLAKIFKFMPKKIARSLSAVLSAQIFGMPVSIAVFGKTSTFAIMANLIFIPLASVVFTALIVCVVIGGVFSIPKIALFLPNYVLKAVNFAINVIDYDIFIVGGISFGIAILIYYVTLLVVCGKFNFKRVGKTVAVCVLSVSLIGSVVGVNVYQNNQTNLYVIGEGSISCALLTTPKENLLVVNKAGAKFTSSRLNQLASKVGVDLIDYVIVSDTAEHTDVHALMTKLNTAFAVRHLFYYGEQRVEEEGAVKYFFPSVDVCNVLTSEGLQTQSTTVRYLLDGKAISVSCSKTDILLYAQMKEKPNLSKIDAEYDLVVAYDYLDRIADLYPRTKLISYKISNLYQNAQKQGRVCYKIA